jgi:hypothetical protein
VTLPPPPAPGAELAGLRTDQAPPLAVPASFFLLAPLALMAAGAVLAGHGPAVLATRWAPLAMATTHLGTLGFLGSIMLGALYQMTPVVAGAPVPAARLAHLVHALLAAGVIALAGGLATGAPAWMTAAPALLGAAFTLFLFPVAVALLRAPTRGETVTGMRLAAAGLAAVVTLGVLLALARTGRYAVRGDWIGWVSAHAALGGLVWVGGLITAVSWQVVPMFYLTPPLPRWSQRATLVAVAAALLTAPAAALLGAGPTAVAAGAAPAAVMIWGVHPVVTMLAIQGRKRKRIDGSARFWWAGLACGPVALGLAVGTVLGDHPRWSVALGFTVVWGWAGLIAHGMLSRIVPFLIWFHRFAALVGKVPVPSMRGLLPDPRIRLGLGVHVAAVLAGEAAILTGWAPAAHATGVLLALTGVVLAANLLHALRQWPAPDPAAPPP